MRQNIRVDIIYYLCDTDFEMEFNLNGCCPMRMLTGQVEDRGALIKNLAKSVQRSKVIMCCGPLFGGDGLIGLVSASIGRNTERVNCEEYGIVTASDISVIEGSVPLVTPDGYFGGCIIESGPQTIILLSENRNIRKTLMTNLIHPYLEEISMLPDLAHRMKNNAENTPEPAAPVAPVVPVNPEAEAEKAAADAAAIVAAALGETAVVTAEAAENAVEEVAEEIAPEISDISSSTTEGETEVAEEITPADVELEIDDAPAEQIVLDLEEAPSEEIKNESKEELETPVEETKENEESSMNIEMEKEEEQSEEPLIIGMVPPEDDNLFDIEEPEAENESEFDDAFIEEIEQSNDLFVAEIEPVIDELPPEEQFMNTGFPEVELYVEPGAVTRKKMDDYAREYVPSKSDEMFLSGDDDDYDYDYDVPKGKKKISLNAPIAVLVILLILILLILGYVLIYVPYSQGVDFEQYMDTLFGTAVITPFLK